MNKIWEITTIISLILSAVGFMMIGSYAIELLITTKSITLSFLSALAFCISAYIATLSILKLEKKRVK